MREDGKGRWVEGGRGREEGGQVKTERGGEGRVAEVS